GFAGLPQRARGAPALADHRLAIVVAEPRLRALGARHPAPVTRHAPPVPGTGRRSAALRSPLPPREFGWIPASPPRVAHAPAGAGPRSSGAGAAHGHARPRPRC